MESQQFTADNFTLDMFGRHKVANPITLFDSHHRYQSSVDFSDEVIGSSSVSYLADEATDSLNIGSTSGDKITRESTKVFQYQPGKSLQIMQTFVMAPPQEGLRQRVGYFSRTNGIYLEQDGTDVSLVIRTNTTGSVVETRIPQANWDRRKMMNGDGPTLNLSTAQIFFIEIEWLGVGSVRCGFVIGGEFYTVHQFDHANWIKKVYMRTATLPLRYEIENTADTSGTSSLKQICATVMSNGGYQWERRSYTAKRDTELDTSTTAFVPVVAIRMKAGRTDSIVIPADAFLFPYSIGEYNAVLLKNPTLTGGAWVASETGNVEYNITATGVTGGSMLYNAYVSSSNQSSGPITLGGSERLFMQLGRTNADTPVSDTIVLAAKSYKNAGSVIGSLSWFDNI